MIKEVTTEHHTLFVKSLASTINTFLFIAKHNCVQYESFWRRSIDYWRINLQVRFL